jgi:membrane protease YdiL (CAAX protease family)
MRLTTKMAHRLAKTSYVRKAIREKADLTPFKGPPSARLVSGLIVLVIGQLMGLPAVVVSGAVAAWLGEPMLLLLGPALYLLSFAVFALAMFLIGPDTINYSDVFFRWAARSVVEKLLGSETVAAIVASDEDEIRKEPENKMGKKR